MAMLWTWTFVQSIGGGSGGFAALGMDDAITLYLGPSASILYFAEPVRTTYE